MAVCGGSRVNPYEICLNPASDKAMKWCVLRYLDKMYKLFKILTLLTPTEQSFKKLDI